MRARVRVRVRVKVRAIESEVSILEKEGASMI